MYALDFTDKVSKLSKGKPINALTHGIIDYSHAALFLTLGLIWRKSNKRASVAALATGFTVLAESLITDYPLGVIPAISFEDHGKVDFVFASSSWLIPILFGFKGTAAGKVFGINSAAESAIVKMTDFDSARAQKS